MKFMISLVVVVILFSAFQLSHAENLDCIFGDILYWFNSYTCNVTSFVNDNNDKIITGYTGKHVDKKGDTDVKIIVMKDIDTKFIPENIGLLFKLTGFVMRNCKLIQIRSKDFREMQHLEYLDLAENKLTTIPAHAFTALINLKSIELSNNQIEELPNGVFSNNLYLVIIQFSNNKIKFIGSNIFDKMSNLAEVDLSGNICVSKYYEYYEIDDLKKDIEINCKKSKI